MKVLVAMDDSKFSQAALQAVVSQIRPTDAEVRVLHVVEPLTVSASPQMAAAYAPELQDQIKTGHELVDRAAETLRAEGFEVDTSVYQVDIREGILESAAHWGADLIVLGSRGRKGSQAVARYAPCSVYVVRIPTRAPANLSDERLAEVSVAGDKTQTPTGMQPKRRTRPRPARRILIRVP